MSRMQSTHWPGMVGDNFRNSKTKLHSISLGALCTPMEFWIPWLIRFLQNAPEQWGEQICVKCSNIDSPVASGSHKLGRSSRVGVQLSIGLHFREKLGWLWHSGSTADIKSCSTYDHFVPLSDGTDGCDSKETLQKQQKWVENAFQWPVDFRIAINSPNQDPQLVYLTAFLSKEPLWSFCSIKGAKNINNSSFTAAIVQSPTDLHV